METTLIEQVQNLTKQIESVISDAIKNGAKIDRNLAWRNEIDGVPVFFDINERPYIYVNLSSDTIVKALRKDEEELRAKQAQLQTQLAAINKELETREAERAVA